MAGTKQRKTLTRTDLTASSTHVAITLSPGPLPYCKTKSVTLKSWEDLARDEAMYIVHVVITKNVFLLSLTMKSKELHIYASTHLHTACITHESTVKHILKGEAIKPSKEVHAAMTLYL